MDKENKFEFLKSKLRRRNKGEAHQAGNARTDCANEIIRPNEIKN